MCSVHIHHAAVNRTAVSSVVDHLPPFWYQCFQQFGPSFGRGQSRKLRQRLHIPAVSFSFSLALSAFLITKKIFRQTKTKHPHRTVSPQQQQHHPHAVFLYPHTHPPSFLFLPLSLAWLLSESPNMHSWHPAAVSKLTSGLTRTATLTDVTDPCGEAESIPGPASGGGPVPPLSAELAIALRECEVVRCEIERLDEKIKNKKPTGLVFHKTCVASKSGSRGTFFSLLFCVASHTDLNLVLYMTSDQRQVIPTDVCPCVCISIFFL